MFKGKKIARAAFAAALPIAMLMPANAHAANIYCEDPTTGKTSTAAVTLYAPKDLPGVPADPFGGTGAWAAYAANNVVGFKLVEQIVDETMDPTLNDNALGYPNENAPGAHRLKLTPTLVAKSRNEISNNDTFFSIFEFSNITTDIAINKQKTPYDLLGEVMNQRTFDESGNYVIKPFITETIVGPNTQSFSYQVSSGKGFVLGASVEYLAARKVDVDKAITTQTANQQIITANFGNYVYVKEYAGALDFANFVTVDLYDNVGFQAIFITSCL